MPAEPLRKTTVGLAALHDRMIAAIIRAGKARDQSEAIRYAIVFAGERLAGAAAK